jgi:shikimate kinase
MSSDPHIVLIGLRGSGKSTLGRLLSSAVNLPFRDLDQLVAEQTGKTGPGAVIKELGIERFRQEETLALTDALDQPRCVLALGGGTPTAAGALDLLGDERSRIIYLRATPETLGHRLQSADNTDRPALIGSDPVSEIETLFEQRDDLYQNIAESIVHVDSITEQASLAALVAIVQAGS